MFYNLCRLTLIVLLSATLATPARAESFQAAGDQIVIGIVVVSALVAVGVTLLILHEKHKYNVITGCVIPGTTGMTVRSEKDNRVYALTGNAAGVKPGDRVTIEGKRRTESGKPPVFEVRSVTRDFGVCQP